MSELDARCFVKRGNTLVPADFAADEMLADIKDGREVMITMRRARNPSHHRWFFSLLHKVVQNTEMWADEQDLLDDLKEATGLCTRRINPFTKRETVRHGGINFAAMDETKFSRWKKRALWLLSDTLGWDAESLMAETDETQRAA